MLKVLSRTASARRQAARRLALQEKEVKRQEIRQRMLEKHQHEKMTRDLVKTAREEAKEDWKLGPLAPRRDVGSAKEEYGAVEQSITMLPQPLPVRLAWQKAMAKRQASGQGWFGNKFHKKDRAVIIRGRDKGKIGVVTDVDWQKQHVILENLNRADVHYPDWILKETGNDADSPIAPRDLPIPMKDVRLVYPITDEEGRTREVIVDRMHIGLNGKRTIPGLGIVIEDSRVKEQRDDADLDPEMMVGDTPRITTELETWHPSLGMPPFPISVIDELRGKYSRFRTRHTDEYIAEQLAKDEMMEVKKKAIALTQTPTQEFVHLQRSEAGKVARQKVLGDDVLAFLGEHMSRKTETKNP